ncbi:hypothetical protein ACQ86N_31625 [Puia sp. P3]|uniref:hypothetical protein n=1 Tax=Puia sp. P3 TaxID=3423952 RepID=UPI003D678577
MNDQNTSSAMQLKKYLPALTLLLLAGQTLFSQPQSPSPATDSARLTQLTGAEQLYDLSFTPPKGILF